ncbi:MAG: tyrosine-type recombinase/integrase [Anaerolineales bacterium]|nr:tyrosine-type recombinase/integrase [Anaerolineales bacterium]
MRLSQAIEALCVATRVDGRSPRTVDSYREKLGYLRSFLGDVPVDAITVDDLRRFVASLLDERTLYAGHPTRQQRTGHLSPFTVQSYMRHIKRLFSWLMEEGHLTTNPAERIKVHKPAQREVKAIAPDDLLAILATTVGGGPIDIRDRALVLLLADTGARAGGICGLRLGDVDLEEGTARVTEKGARFRFVYFTEPTAQAIREWLDVRPVGKGAWLFTSLRDFDEDGISPNSLRTMLKRRAAQAGVTGPCGPHSFRHGFAVSYLMDGGDLASLADLLGHSSVMVTQQFYSVFTREQLRQKHARHSPVARMLGGNGQDGENKN